MAKDARTGERSTDRLLAVGAEAVREYFRPLTAIASAIAGQKSTGRDNDLPLFIAAFVFGLAAVLIGEARDLRSLILLGPVVALLAHTVAGVTFGYRAVPGFADRIYFLGFMFALVSLSAALWSFAAVPRQSIANVDSNLTQFDAMQSMLARFGLALVSSVVGLGLRIVVGTTARDDPPETAWIARAGEEAIGAYSAATRRITDELESMATRLSEQMSRTATHHELTMTGVFARASDFEANLAKSVVAAHSEMEREWRSVREIVSSDLSALVRLVERNSALAIDALQGLSVAQQDVVMGLRESTGQAQELLSRYDALLLSLERARERLDHGIAVLIKSAEAGASRADLTSVERRLIDVAGEIGQLTRTLREEIADSRGQDHRSWFRFLGKSRRRGGKSE